MFEFADGVRRSMCTNYGKRAGAKEQPLVSANVFSVDLATFGALPLWDPRANFRGDVVAAIL